MCVCCACSHLNVAIVGRGEVDDEVGFLCVEEVPGATHDRVRPRRHL